MRHRNQELSINPAFISLNNYEIYLVNESTNTNTLHELIRLAQSSQYFSIDTESDLYTNCPALIQIDELRKFLIYELYTEEALWQSIMVDIQKEFKPWRFEQIGFYETGQHPWGLQNAIYKMYNEFLDKIQRLNRWSQGLYRQKLNPKIQSMIQYASNDCRAVTKLAVSMQQLTVSKRIYISL